MAGTLPSTISTLSRLTYDVDVVHTHAMSIVIVVVSSLVRVSACSFLDLIGSPSLVGTIPDTITTMTALRFVVGHACLVSVVHAATSAAMRACDLPCVAEPLSFSAAASRETFHLASATLSGLCTSRIRHKNRGQQCVCDTIVLHAVRRRYLSLAESGLDGSIPTSMGLLTNLE
jgi:hypothetical protein